MPDEEFERELNALRRASAQDPQPEDIAHVLPVIVPRTFFALGNWPGPYLNLRHPDLALTWAILRPEQTMSYVNHERAALWLREGVEWQSRSLSNLATCSGDAPWTDQKTDDTGSVVFAAMMHSDGLGASRALLCSALTSGLGPQVVIGLPDRSCGIVFANSTVDIGGQSPAQMVRAMFDGATTPLFRELITPEQLELA